MKLAVAAAILFLSASMAGAAPATTLPSDRATQERQIEALRRDWHAGKFGQAVGAGELQILHNWLDLFESEGCVHPSAIEETPLRMFDMLRQSERELALGSPQLPVTFDWLMRKLDRLSDQWFADGTVGDISDRWTSVPPMKLELVDHGTIWLTSTDPQRPYDLFVDVFQGNVVRIHGISVGYFVPTQLHFADVKTTVNANAIDAVWDGGTARIETNPLAITLKSSSGRSWNWLTPSTLHDAKTEAITATRQRVVLRPEDRCLGLGERFDAIDHRGKVVNDWPTDAVMSGVREKYTEVYKPVPLVLNPAGASMFVNNQSLVRFDLGATDAATESIVQRGDVLDDYLFLNPPMETLRQYTLLTGRVPLLPDWAFTPWMGGGGDRWNKADPGVGACQEVRNVVARFKSLDIPHGAIYIEGVPTGPGEGSELLKWLLSQNIKPLAWYGPQDGGDKTYGYDRSRFDSMMIHHLDGSLFKVPPERFLSGDHYIDFTNPQSVELLKKKWKWHLDAGIHGCMIDGGEEVPMDAVACNGMSGDVLHNLYPYFYHRAQAELFDQIEPGDHVIFGRSGGPGDQANIAQFAGDLPGDFGGLTAAIHALITISSSGFSNWGSDIGGYYTRKDAPLSKEVYTRWAEFGFFSPIARFHSSKQPREPWMYDDETVATYKYFAWLRMNYQPYLVQTAAAAHTSGEPVVRPVAIMYPDDAQAGAIDDEYLLGPDLLIAPVHSGENTRAVYLPQGTWYDLSRFAQDHSAALDGSLMMRREVALGEIPVFGRGGAVVSLTLNSDWKLGASFSPGSRPVQYLMLDPYHPSAESADGQLTVTAADRDLLIRAQRESSGGLWIPSNKPCDVLLGGKPLAKTGDVKSLSEGQFCFDPDGKRICVQVDLQPGHELRVVGYVHRQ